MAEETKPSEETKTSTAEAPASAPANKKSNKTVWIILAVVLVVFIVIPGILLTIGGLFLKNAINSDKAGEKLTESLIESASGGNVDVNSEDGSFTVESEDGSGSVGFGTNQKLPEDFPKDEIPYLDEKAVTFVLTSDNEDGHSWSVTTTVDKSLDEAANFFADKIKSPEYTDVSTYSFGDSKTYYGKKDKLTVSVTVAKTETDTTVTYMVTDDTVHTH